MERWKMFSQLEHGRENVIIRSLYSRLGSDPIIFMKGRYDAKKYNKMQKNLVSLVNVVHSNGWMIQQHNVSIKSALITQRFLWDNDIYVLPQPARFPNINHIKNAWSVLAKSVHAKYRQFSNSKELKVEIVKAWLKVDTSFFWNYQQLYVPPLQGSCLGPRNHGSVLNDPWLAYRVLAPSYYGTVLYALLIVACRYIFKLIFYEQLLGHKCSLLIHTIKFNASPHLAFVESSTWTIWPGNAVVFNIAIILTSTVPWTVQFAQKQINRELNN